MINVKLQIDDHNNFLLASDLVAMELMIQVIRQITNPLRVSIVTSIMILPDDEKC